MRVLHDGKKARIELTLAECRLLREALMMAIAADQTAGRLLRVVGVTYERSAWTRLAFDLADALAAVIGASSSLPG